MDDNNKHTLHTYQHFGMKKEWLTDFLFSTQDWVRRNTLGSCQFDAMMMWLKHAELIFGDKRSLTITPVGEMLAQKGSDDLMTWAVIWTNLVRNSSIVRWYVNDIPWGVTMTKTGLISKVGEQYSQSESTRKNAISALIGLLINTPLGSEMGLGEEINKSKHRNIVLNKKGWNEPMPVAILYSLYRFAEKTGRYELTVHELYEGAEEGPYTLFGVKEDILKGILNGLSSRGDGLIRVNIVRDLDNIFLDSTIKSIEVLDII